MTNWNVNLPKKETPYMKRKSLIPMDVWRRYEHEAKVSRSSACSRVERGWSIVDAITTPAASITRAGPKDILHTLSEDNKMTRAEIAEAIGVNPITLVKHLNNLMERGALKRVREGMTYYYFLSHADIPKKKKRRNEDNYEMKPYVNPIRQRALDDLEKLKKMKQK